MLVGPGELVVVVLMTVFAGVLPALAFWRICSRAGLPGALGLLMLLPVANVILPLYVAFADWPTLRQAQAP